MSKSRVLAALLLSLSLLSVPALAYDETATYPIVARAGAPGERVALRAAPDPDAPVLGLYYTGARMGLTDAGGGEWRAVTPGWINGSVVSGYLRAGQVYTGNPEEIVCEVPVAEVCAAQAALRAEPSPTARAVGTLPKGTRVSVLGETGDGAFCHVTLGERQGYLPAEVLAATGQDALLGGSLPAIGYGVRAAGDVPLQILPGEPDGEGRFVPAGTWCELLADLGDTLQVRAQGGDFLTGFVPAEGFTLCRTDGWLLDDGPLLPPGEYAEDELPAGLYTLSQSEKGHASVYVGAAEPYQEQLLTLDGPGACTFYLPEGAELIFSGDGELAPMRREALISWALNDGLFFQDGRYYCPEQLPFGESRSFIAFYARASNTYASGTVTVYSLLGEKLQEYAIGPDVEETRIDMPNDGFFVETRGVVLMGRCMHG